jgi:hypothetical protein
MGFGEGLVAAAGLAGGGGVGLGEEGGGLEGVEVVG